MTTPSTRGITAIVAVVAAMAVASMVVAGCGGPDARRATAPTASDARSGRGCLPPIPASVTPAARVTGASGRLMPDVTLPCLTGGGSARLSELRGPALVNLWSSSCAPCRTELPAIQRYADRAAGRVGVVGVVTTDRRSAAQSVVDDLHLRFDMLEDRDGTLLRALGRATLPVTLFITADGRVAETYVGAALTDAVIDELVRRNLAVAVPT